MVLQILGFSVLFILVFGGMIGAIIKFTLYGNVQVDVSSRMVEERLENTLGQMEEKSGSGNEKASCPSGEAGIHELSKKAENKVFRSAS